MRGWDLHFDFLIALALVGQAANGEAPSIGDPVFVAPTVPDSKTPAVKVVADVPKPKFEDSDALRAPEAWYESTTRMFYFCLAQKFHHPLCPAVREAIRPTFTTMVALASANSPAVLELSPYERVKEPTGALTSQSLFEANILYQLNRPPMFWLVSLKLNGARPKNVDAKLWANAQWLLGKIYFDMKKFKESMALYDLAVDELKSKSLFHQERAWVFFFNGKFDRALGSIVSADSPLVYQIPFFEKYFVRALSEKDTCNYEEAFNTIEKGRIALDKSQANPDQHPWVILCERENLGPVCGDLKSWYGKYFTAQIDRAKRDLDLVEVELRDKGLTKPAKPSSSEIVWPFIGEHWADEVGYYSVPIPTRCS